jgi:hypothetical protein
VWSKRLEEGSYVMLFSNSLAKLQTGPVDPEAPVAESEMPTLTAQPDRSERQLRQSMRPVETIGEPKW